MMHASKMVKYTVAIKHFSGRCLELLFVNIALLIVPRLSRKAVINLSKILGGIAMIFGRRIFRVALVNLDIVYGDTKTAREKRTIAKASYRHFGLVMLEYFWLMKDTTSRLQSLVNSTDPVIERWITGTFPGLFVTAHIGNWEVGGQYIALRGRVMTSIYRPIGTAKTMNALTSFREATGQNLISREGAMPFILRAIRNNSLIAMVLDQHTEIDDGGIYIDFFGLPATISGAAGIFANRLKVPICIAAAIRNPETDTYSVYVERELNPEDTDGLTMEKITQMIVDSIESMIKKHPEQWLWSYRRWKRYRSIDDKSLFPFYAKLDTLYKE